MDVLPAWCGQFAVRTRPRDGRASPSRNALPERAREAISQVSSSAQQQPCFIEKQEAHPGRRHGSEHFPVVPPRRQSLIRRLPDLKARKEGVAGHVRQSAGRVCARCRRTIDSRSGCCRICQAESCEPVLATSSKSEGVSINGGRLAMASTGSRDVDNLELGAEVWRINDIEEGASRRAKTDSCQSPLGIDNFDAVENFKQDDGTVFAAEFVKVPEAVKGKVVGSKCRHLAQLRKSTGVINIFYDDHRLEAQVVGDPDSVAAAVKALQKRIDFFQNAHQLQAALYPHPVESYFLLSSKFTQAAALEFVQSKARACLGGAMACELRTADDESSTPATWSDVRMADGQMGADLESQPSPFFENSSRGDLIRRFMSSARRVQAHEVPAPFDQVKVLFIMGVQQFYPLASWDRPLGGLQVSFKQLQEMRVIEPKKSMRTEFCTVLSEKAVKAIAARFRSISTVGVRVSRSRGLDLYLNDHELSVALRIRFEITSGAPFSDNWRRLHPLSIKTTNTRPFMLTVVNPAGVLDFRIELAAWYQLQRDGKEEFREAWRVAKACLWNSQKPSEVRLPSDSHARFTVRRVKYWEDVTLMGRLPWAAVSERLEEGGMHARHEGDGEIKSGCDLHVVVTKSIERKKICYAVTGCCPQMVGSNGPLDIKERELATVIDFCSDTCNLDI